MINAQTVSDFLEKKINTDINCVYFGLVNTDIPNSLSFLDDEKFIDTLNENSNITAVFVTKHISGRLRENVAAIIVDDPRYYFYSLLNHLLVNNYRKKSSLISPTLVFV